MKLLNAIRFSSALFFLVSAPAAFAGGTVEGKVLFKGPAPALTPLAVTKDVAACGSEEVPDPRFVVDSGGGLRWTVLELQGVPSAASPETPADLPRIQQKGCTFLPHVLLVPKGVQVEVTNEDGILHNVHTYSEKNLPLNRAQPKFLKVMKIGPFEVERFPIQCDVHAWMRAWVQVMDHPFYAVSDTGGTFRIENVPPGSYRLAAWHEKLGEMDLPIQVAEGETTAIEVVYGP